jgi:hypothetical protein
MASHSLKPKAKHLIAFRGEFKREEIPFTRAARGVKRGACLSRSFLAPSSASFACYETAPRAHFPAERPPVPASRRPKELQTASPAFLFFGVFGGDPALIDEVGRLVERRFGPLHPRGVSSLFPFPETRTYAPQMGRDLTRRFYVLARPWPQEGLAPVKLAAMEMEEEIRIAGRSPAARPVNIDPGLINDSRIILASTKDQAHRLYRGGGIWEEITLIYRHGAYHPLPWTYRDFLNPGYHRFFEAFRDELLGRARSSLPTQRIKAGPE